MPISQAGPVGLGERHQLLVPRWVNDGIGWNEQASVRAEDAGVGLHVSSGAGFMLVSARVADAVQLSADAFGAATVEAYRLVFEQLGKAHHPVRFWNFLPAIHQDMGKGRSRYMTFNSGRFEAFSQQYGGRDSFDQQVATATGVGHDSPDLIIHCLASDRPCRHVGNPRQISPHCYSSRYGPLPPCFARATIVQSAMNVPMLLVGGTASICGEESRHVGNLAEQCEETLRNLAALVRAAKVGVESDDESSSLERFTELRVYHPRAVDADWLGEHLPMRFPNVQRMEFCRADLCRSELLVEIEGVVGHVAEERAAGG